MIFNDRLEAGNKLAIELKKYKNDSQTIVMAIPRGGVEVAFYVCQELSLPMEITIARKIGAPFNPELAIGAVSERDTVILNNSLIKIYGISDSYIKNKIQEEKEEINKRLKTYRQGKPLINFENKNIIIVDDGIATGATIKAVIQLYRNINTKKIIVAVPVAARETIREIKDICDEVFCLFIPNFFDAVGSFYRNFNQVTDKEVIEFIKKAKEKYEN